MGIRKVFLGIFVFLFITSSLLGVSATVDPKKLPPVAMEGRYKLGTSAVGNTFTILRDGQILQVDDEQSLEVGDIYAFEDEPIWIIQFTNCGEAGGAQYAKAEYFSTGVITKGRMVTKKTYLEIHKRYGIDFQEVTTGPMLPRELLYTYTFSGGPEGEFKLDGNTVMYLVEGGSRIYDPSSKRYFEVENWQQGFQSTGEEQKETVCSVAGLSGQIEWSPTGERNTWKLLQFGDKLPENAHIKTEEDSSVILSFPDMSQYIMKPESHIVLTTDPNTKRSNLSIAAGQVWVNVKKMLETGSVEVDMQQAVCGIKGTTFICEEVNGKSTLKVIEGTVEFTSKNDGKSIMVEGGQQVLADQGGLSELSSFDAAAEQAEWTALEKSTVSGSASNDSAIKDQATDKKPLPLALIGGVGVAVVLIVIMLLATGKRKKTVHKHTAMPEQPMTQPTGSRFCSKCGSKLDAGTSFCTGCGNPIK